MQRGNPFALGLIGIGAVIMAVSTFLPLNEPLGVFGRVRDNTLIQSGGWMLIAAAVGIAGAGFAAFRGNKSSWVTSIVVSVIAALTVFYWFTNTDMRTLYPVGTDGQLDTTRPGQVASLGIALYVAAVGVGIAFAGALMSRPTEGEVDSLELEWTQAPKAPTKKCPDCAETILTDAKVCKHCGYRFTPASAVGAPKLPPAAPPAPVEKWTVTCPLCDAEQKIPLEATRFTCGRCKEISPAPD